MSLTFDVYNYATLEQSAFDLQSVVVPQIAEDLASHGMTYHPEIRSDMRLLGDYPDRLSAFLMSDDQLTAPIDTVQNAITFAGNLSHLLISPGCWGISFDVFEREVPSPTELVHVHSLHFLDACPTLADICETYIDKIASKAGERIIGKKVVGLTLFQVEAFRTAIRNTLVQNEFARMFDLEDPSQPPIEL